MSRINDLIEELCPDGVPFIELRDLISYEQPGKYLVQSVNYSNSYSTPVLTAGKSFLLGYTDETDGVYHASCDDPVIIFDDFTTSFKWVYFDFKVKSSAIKLLKVGDQSRVLIRYVYFAMSNIWFEPQDHSRQWIGTYSRFKIPVPPIEVQREIVRILDQFTQLEAELERRRQQFEHYRNTLLTFTEEGGRWTTMGEIAQIGTGRHDTKDALETGAYVFYARGRVPLALDVFDFDEEAVITAGDGVGVGKVFHYVSGKYALHQRAYRIVPNHEVHGRYLFHFLEANFSSFLEKTSVHASVTSLRRPMFLKFPVLVPSLRQQHRIAEKLDSLESLSGDIEIGLPAEIAARRKQYEYYRDKLLTFKELK